MSQYNHTHPSLYRWPTVCEQNRKRYITILLPVLGFLDYLQPGFIFLSFGTSLRIVRRSRQELFAVPFICPDLEVVLRLFMTIPPLKGRDN